VAFQVAIEQVLVLVLVGQVILILPVAH